MWVNLEAAVDLTAENAKITKKDSYARIAYTFHSPDGWISLAVQNQHQFPSLRSLRSLWFNHK